MKKLESRAIEVRTIEIIMSNKLNKSLVAKELDINREILSRLISGSRHASQDILQKLELFIQKYEAGQIDIDKLIVNREVILISPVYYLKDNERFIPDCNNNYVVNKEGQVYSVRRCKYLTAYINTSGYYKVAISGKEFYVHRLVATAFLSNPENLPEVNHKNGIKSDNSLQNLEWISSYDNIHHAILNGFFMGKGCVQIDRYTNVVIASYRSIAEAHRATGISSSSIVSCCKGHKHYKTAGGSRWEYRVIFTDSNKGRVTNAEKVLTDSVILWVAN